MVLFQIFWAFHILKLCLHKRGGQPSECHLVYIRVDNVHIDLNSILPRYVFSSLWLAFFWKVKLILINVYPHVYYVIKEKCIKLITFVYKQRVCNFKQKYARWNNCILSGQVAVMLMHVCGYFCPSMVWHLIL